MSDREWMYSGWSRGKPPSHEWIENTNSFLDRAFSMLSLVENDTIKCPCALCRNYVRHERFDVEMHLCKNEFRDDYRIWTSHGESHVQVGSDESSEEIDHMDEMLVDLGADHALTSDEEPTASAQAFYRMVSSADQPVHDSTTHSSLSAVARLLALKSQYNMSIAHFEANLDLINELLPPESKIPKDFYESKKLLEGLGMSYVKIDVCYNNCMFYYKDNESKDKRDVCGTSRYEEGQNRVPRKVLRYLPIKDRLQRLYAHEKTAKLMQSHKQSRSGKMLHPCDGEAWKQFDKDFPDFGRDPRNVRLAVATDGFTPFSINAAPYSCFKYWTSDEYKKKREIAQNCCMSSEDNAQNRGGSRNFSETQQLLEHNFGREKSGTLNTYAVMKSGYKTVDSTGRAGPIPSQKAQKRMDDYRELVPDENSQELDGKALHIVGNGMKHGRVPIGDGVVDKAAVLVHSKSVAMKPINPADYDRVVKENEQLKETNGMLQETNGILHEENSINRALIMEMYFDFGKEPSAALLRRIESIEARHQQAARSPQGCSRSVDDRRNGENTEESDDDESSHGGNEDGEDPDLEREDDGDAVGEGDY